VPYRSGARPVFGQIASANILNRIKATVVGATSSEHWNFPL
jgi:hypothetical protein